MPEHEAIIEIQSLSLNARHHLAHVFRCHLQVIAGHSEERQDNLLPLPIMERLKAISEVVQDMSEDMRCLGF